MKNLIHWYRGVKPSYDETGPVRINFIELTTDPVRFAIQGDEPTTREKEHAVNVMMEMVREQLNKQLGLAPSMPAGYSQAALKANNLVNALNFPETHAATPGERQALKLGWRMCMQAVTAKLRAL